MTASQNTPDDTERIEQLASQVLLLIQFAATMIDDIDLLEKVEKQSGEMSSRALTLAPIFGAVGGDYEEAHMEAELHRKRASAIVNLVRVLKETENERQDFKTKQANKKKVLAQLQGLGIS